MTDKKMNIHQRIHAIMKDISYVKKGGTNTFQKYKFVSHDDVTRLVREQLVKHEVIAIPTVKEHSKCDKQEKNGVAILTHVDVSIDFVNIDNPEDKITVNGFGYGIDKNDLGPGKAVSYACKMIYLKTFALETGEKDNEDTADDNNAAQKKEPVKQEISDAEKHYNRIGHALENAVNSEDAAQIYNDNIQHITGFHENDQKILSDLKDRFGGTFPGDDNG